MQTTTTRTERPWGWFDVHEEDEINPYKVKTICIKPNHQFSLQRHTQRQEFWVVVEGDAIVTTSTYKCDVKRGDYIHIRKNEIHRMSAGEFGVKFVEVQVGSICDEEDIVRLEDDYGREKVNR
jgi:mannose-6-phosphate isomerase-like protein (cupin superfamily)